MNAYSIGKSGADIALIELLKRLTYFKKTIITSKKGINLCKSLNLTNISSIITSQESEVKNILWIYIKRTLNILFSTKIPKSNAILLSSSDFFPDVIPCFLLKKHNKWIATIYHLYPHYKNRQGKIYINFIAYYLQKFSFFLIKQKADLVIVSNKLVKKQLINLNFDKNKIQVVLIGIDISFYEKIKQGKTKYDAIYLGRLNYSKGIFDLIDFWKKVTSKIKSAKLAIIGEGSKEIKKALLKTIKDNKLDNNIIYLGYLSDKKAFSVIKSTKLLVNPSHEEGFGLTTLQAMACNVPVISWNLASYKYTFEDNLMTIKKGNISAFSKKIIKLLGNTKQRDNISKRACIFVKKYDWKYILPEYINIINKI